MPEPHVDKVMKVLETGGQAAFSPIAASWCRSGIRHGLDPSEDGRKHLFRVWPRRAAHISSAGVQTYLPGLSDDLFG